MRKWIVLAVIVLELSVFLGLYLYVKHLQNKVADLDGIISEQIVEIGRLNAFLENKGKEINALKASVNITNEYVKKLEERYESERKVKQDIQHVIETDEASRDWYDTEIPSCLIESLHNSMLCEDSNSN